MLKKILEYFYFLSFLVILIAVSSIPSFISLNYLILDRLQGDSMPARKEVVVIGIDDKSLQKIGAWPWDRSVFATAFNNLNQHKPRVVALDVLFLESRQGDSEFQESLNKVSFNTVLGAKDGDGALLKGVFSTPKTSNGLIDFSPDTDAKIRRNNLARSVGGKCENTFSLEIYIKYLGLKNPETCKDTIRLRNTEIPNSYEFLYSTESFQEYSFLDLYENKIDRSNLQDKMILIGSTAKDLRSNLNDNFQDVFGGQISGVKIHANVLNSLLQNKYQAAIEYPIFAVSSLFLGLLVFFIFRILKRSFLEFGFFLALLLLNNFSGLVLYNFGWNWLFFQSNFLIIASYVYFIAYKYFIIQAESRVTEKAFSKYVSGEVLRQIKENPKALKLGGQKREVTVFFSDIRGFTTFSEKLSPEELIALINDYLSIMTEIIIDTGGLVDKYIGDAIMAFWNAPLDQDEHVLLALSASLKMQKALIQFNLKNGWEMKVGMSLNTGPVIVGNVGGKERFDYTILGDNVNLGSRLEGLTKKYGIEQIVAESVILKLETTVKKLKTENTNEADLLLKEAEGLTYRFLDEVRVKGKTKALKIFEPMEKTPENLNKIEVYEKGFRLYQKGDFKEAIKELKKIEKTDFPAQLVLQRCQKLLENKPQDWEGVWNWDEK